MTMTKLLRSVSSHLFCFIRRQIFFGQSFSEESEVSVTQFVPLSVTQFRIDRSATAANGGTHVDVDGDGEDITDGRAAKRRKIQVSFGSSILEKLSRPDANSEESLIPWVQIVQRMVEKFPAIFLQR